MNNLKINKICKFKRCNRSIICRLRINNMRECEHAFRGVLYGHFELYIMSWNVLECKYASYSKSTLFFTPINMHVLCNSTPYNISYTKVVFYPWWSYNLFQNVLEWNLVLYSNPLPLITPINTYTSCNSMHFEIFNIMGFSILIFTFVPCSGMFWEVYIYIIFDLLFHSSYFIFM